MTRVAVGWLALLVLLGLGGPWLGYDPVADVHPERASAWPSWSMPLGADHLGRDVAWRSALATSAFAAPALASAALAVLGGMAGLTLGWALPGAEAPRRWAEGARAIPDVVVVLLAVLIFGASPGVLAAAAGATQAPVVFEDALARVRAARSSGFLLGCRAHGVPAWRVVVVHLGWGRSRGLLVRHAARTAGAFVVLEATLSWLGTWGVQEPSPSWGNMIAFDWGHPNPFATATPALLLWSVVLATGRLASRWRTDG